MLKQIHAATHPGARLNSKPKAEADRSQEEQMKAALLEALAHEASEDGES